MKKVLRLLLAVVMLLSCVPAPLFANAAEGSQKLYLKPNANWLKDGVLWSPNDEVYNLLNITREFAVVAQDDKDILAKFKLNAKQFTAWLDEIDSKAVLQKVYEVACEYDGLPMNKMEIIEKKTGKSISMGRRQRDGE